MRDDLRQDRDRDPGEGLSQSVIRIAGVISVQIGDEL
jgi:hypothetical protein